jgi:two-component system, chemotaxis family, chemotaxis protein CheY
LSDEPQEFLKVMSTPLLLIVDDSKMARMMVTQFVRDLRPEWRLKEAATGDEALALIEQEPPNFISLDVNMPGISGLEAAGRIRLHHPDIRIALCTANIQDAVRKAAEKAGIKFVGKPITAASIATMVALFEE